MINDSGHQVSSDRGGVLGHNVYDHLVTRNCCKLFNIVLSLLWGQCQNVIKIFDAFVLLRFEVCLTDSLFLCQSLFSSQYLQLITGGVWPASSALLSSQLSDVVLCSQVKSQDQACQHQHSTGLRGAVPSNKSAENCVETVSWCWWDIGTAWSHALMLTMTLSTDL